MIIKEDNLVEILKKSFINNWKKPALSNYTTKITHTYKEVCDKILKLHLLFEKCDITGNTKIGVLGKNSSNWAISYLSIVTNGSIVVPILDDFNPIDIENILNHSETEFVFCDAALWKNINQKNLTTLKYAVSIDHFEFLYACNTVGEIETEYAKRYPQGATTENLNFRSKEVDEMMSLNYTSGTTSLTKGVMLSSKSLSRNAVYVKYEYDIRKIDITKTVCVLPMAHAYGLAYALLGPLVFGAEIYFLGKAPSPNLMLEVCQSVKPEQLILVPLIFEKIYKYNIAPIFTKKFVRMIHEVGFLDKILHRVLIHQINKKLGGNLKEVIIGGAPFNAHIEKFLLKGKFPFTVGYGMTECGPLISYVAHDKFVHNSVGKKLRGNFLDIRIEKNKESDESGEIQAKGDSVMLGYYKDPEATAAAFTKDGWLKTGDKGYMDADGNLFIKGRYKTMLLGPSGENIYPEAIETKLSSLPLVGECIVVQNDKFKLEAYVYPDYPQMKIKGIDDAAMREILEKDRLKLNRITAKYENISAIYILDTPLPKTPKNTVKRYGLEKHLKKN